MRGFAVFWISVTHSLSPSTAIPIPAHGGLPPGPCGVWCCDGSACRRLQGVAPLFRSHDLSPSLAPPLKISILLLSLPLAMHAWRARTALRRWRGLWNTSLQAFAMSGPSGGTRRLDRPNKRDGGASTASAPAPSQHGRRAVRVDARAGPRRTDQRQKTRPRAGLPRRRVTAARIPFRTRMRARRCAGRKGAGSWRWRLVVRRVLERL